MLIIADIAHPWRATGLPENGWKMDISIRVVYLLWKWHEKRLMKAPHKTVRAREPSSEVAQGFNHENYTQINCKKQCLYYLPKFFFFGKKWYLQNTAIQYIAPKDIQCICTCVYKIEGHCCFYSVSQDPDGVYLWRQHFVTSKGGHNHNNTYFLWL